MPSESRNKILTSSENVGIKLLSKVEILTSILFLIEYKICCISKLWGFVQIKELFFIKGKGMSKI